MAPSSSLNDAVKQSIITAVLAGNLELLKKLAKDIDNGVGIEKALKEVWGSCGWNALHAAAAAASKSERKLDVCKYLVEELNFNVNEEDAKGDTPLHLSTLEEDYDISAYLLDHGADPNIAMDLGYTPLHYAAMKGQTNLLSLLISNGAQVDAQSDIGTPLQVAAALGRNDAVIFLLTNHANPNFACPDTLPPLMYAIYAKSCLCARSLLEWGADANVVSCGVTPLIVAATEEQTDTINCLLYLGADADVPDFFGFKPIEIAALKGNHSAVKSLFTATTPIPGISDWSVFGIFKYVMSPEAIKYQVKTEEKFLQAKEKGAQAVKNGHYREASLWYTEAFFMKPTNAAVLSNRSLCWARLKRGDQALQDAMACIELRGDWPKAHYRAGVAWGLLRDYEKAKEEFKIALDLDPENEELQVAYREAALDVIAVEMYKKKHGIPSKYDVDPHDEYYEEYINSLY